MIDFLNLAYLRNGSAPQQLAFRELVHLRLMERLARWDPLLVGTVPIGIDVSGSDLDVICEVDDFEEFAQVVERFYGQQPAFCLTHKKIRDRWCIVASFQGEHFPVELFGQAVPTQGQYAYRHMLVEHRLLEELGDAFRQQIVALKKAGYKTEPAFAKVLGLEGDPYEILLSLEK